MYFQRHRNPNLIAIVPVEEEIPPQVESFQTVAKTEFVTPNQAMGKIIKNFS